MQNSILGLAHHDSLEWTRREHVENARHRTEFEMLCILGRGAFGTTYKVKNRVDSHIYALKCVKLGSNVDTEECNVVLREVEVLSSVNHDNVVRYYGAWLEKGEDGIFTTNDCRCGGSFYTDSESDSAHSKTNNLTKDPMCHLCQTTYKDWEVSFEQWGLIDAVLQPLDLCTYCYMKSIPPQIDTSTIHVRDKEVLPLYLFILMEYCPGNLIEVVKSCEDDKAIWSHFAQSVQGLAHLHSKGIIHRDVKPSNILVHEDGVVKIGDLGLATYTPSPSPSVGLQAASTAHESPHSKSSQVGTFLYAAPEVTTGRYNEKCDVYSLGIVLVEMFHSFATGMERAKVLGGLRSLSFPKDWVSTHEFQVKLAKQLLAKDPTCRPSCSQILGQLIQEDLMALPANNPSIVHDLVADFNEQIAKLQSQLQDKNQEVSQLRQLLDDKHIDHSHIA